MEKGQYPNVQCQAVLIECLRSHPQFDALPPVEAAFLSHPVAFRFVRQDSKEWSAVRKGRLSSAWMAAALDFQWSPPSRKRATGRRTSTRGSSYTLTDVYRHLRAPPHPSATECPADGAALVQLYRDCSALVDAYKAPVLSSFLLPQQERLQAAKELRHGTGVGMAWGNAQEAAALLEVVDFFAGSRLKEVGLCVFDPENWLASMRSEHLAMARAAARGQDASCKTLSLASSPDALVVHPAGAKLWGTLRTASQRLIEVVEVKNLCPFVECADRSAGARPCFMLCQKKLPTSLRPQWALQIQLHMLCAGAGKWFTISCRVRCRTGTSSGLLVCRSATSGTHIFRSFRDDAYLCLLLQVLKRLAACVREKKVPSENLYKGWAKHRDLLNATVNLANSAELIARVAAPPLRRERDCEWFLDEHIRT